MIASEKLYDDDYKYIYLKAVVEVLSELDEEWGRYAREVYLVEQMRIGIDLNVAPMHIISIDYADTFNIPMYDVYAILHLADISYAQLWQRVERKRPGVVSQRNYMLLPEHYDSLQHAFTQFKGIEQHHDFDSIISVVSYFMTKYMKGDVVIWDHNQLIWKSGE